LKWNVILPSAHSAGCGKAHGWVEMEYYPAFGSS
jgi:hypothetical protein